MSSPYLVAATVLALMLAFHEIGFRAGRRLKDVEEDYRKRVDMIRNSTLALVSFLIGFAFAGAGSRYIERQDMIVKEANAIGTAWLRAVMLPEPQKSDLRAALKQYAADRLELVKRYDSDDVEVLLAKAAEAQRRFWQIGVAGVGSDRPLANFMLSPLNDVIDSHSAHLSAARRHVPTLIIVVIVIMAALAMGMVGYDNGLVRKRYLSLSCVFGLIAATSLWMTIDLDRPRHGLIRVSDQPYVELLQSME
jgi:hypothetical protein